MVGKGVIVAVGVIVGVVVIVFVGIGEEVNVSVSRIGVDVICVASEDCPQPVEKQYSAEQAYRKSFHGFPPNLQRP